MNAVVFIKSVKHQLFLLRIILKRKHRKVVNKPIIYVFGDSHTMNFQHALFLTTHVGPATAYNLSSSKSTTQAGVKIDNVLDKLSSSSSHYFLFVFGEIDCRIHINKVSKTLHKSLDKVVGDTVDAYVSYLQSIQLKFPQSRIMVLNVLPSGEEKNIYNTKFYPSRALHLKIVLLFNEELSKKCKENKFIFISVFNQLVDASHKRIRRYVYDDIHFNRKIIPFITTEIFKKAGLA